MAVRNFSEQPDLRGHVPPMPEPRPAVPLHTSPEAITAAADDFGHLVHEVPAAVCRPRTAAEVADLVRDADAAGLAVRARGGGASGGGHAQRAGAGRHL